MRKTTSGGGGQSGQGSGGVANILPAIDNAGFSCTKNGKPVYAKKNGGKTYYRCDNNGKISYKCHKNFHFQTTPKVACVKNSAPGGGGNTNPHPRLPNIAHGIVVCSNGKVAVDAGVKNGVAYYYCLHGKPSYKCNKGYGLTVVDGKQKCAKGAVGGPGVSPLDEAGCKARHRLWDGGKCTKTCDPKTGYHLVFGTPYDKCVKGSGGGTSDPTPKNKAKHNCTEVLHRVWKDGKCTAKCIDGYHVSKANPHKCVLHVNKGDKQPPTIKLTAPADSANVSDSLDYAATATDNVGVAEVTFYRSEEPVGSGTPQFSEVDSDDTKPYTASEDISDVTAGKYAVYAVATDTNGNTKKSQVVNVNIGEGSGNNGGGDILSGKCTKDFTVNRNLPRPDALEDEKLVGGIGFESTCPAAGDTAGVKITVLSSEYTVDELTVYRKTSAGEYSDVTADITAEDVDDASGDTTHVEITYVAKDGDDYDLNSVAAKLKNEVYITTDAEGGNDEENNNGGTTTTTNSNGSITTTGSNGTKTTTDANGNTYVNGQSTAKDKGSGALPNTGTSAFLGVLGVVAALVGAIVYRLAKKKGLHLPSDSQFLGNNNNQGV